MKIKSYFIYLPLLLILFSLFVTRTIRTSVFLKSKERVNIVFYGKESNFYSIDTRGILNYHISFYPDLRTDVPGGYGEYRLGALAKLISLEKKPEIIRKTFSYMTGSFIDLYFYPATSEIFFGKDTVEKTDFPKVFDTFTHKSNSNLFDRIYLSLFFLKKTGGRFSEIDKFNIINNDRFQVQQFIKNYQGNFYKKIYRKEGLNIQLIYKDNYETALRVGQIIEGEGIRVADINQEEKNEENCQLVIEKNQSSTKTAEALSGFFNCRLVIGETGAYDIILKLGKKEKDWEIN